MKSFSKFTASIALVVAFSGGIAAAEPKTGESESNCPAMNVALQKNDSEQVIAPARPADGISATVKGQ